MKPILTYIVLILTLLTNPLLGQNNRTLRITKINGSYKKVIKLPVNLRLLKQNGESIIFRLDSIRNGYFYGNNDSISLSDVHIVNLRGTKEVVKYTSIAVCTAITIGATYFTIYAFNYPVHTEGNNEIYKYIGMAYMAAFGSLGTTIYLYPRTRFRTTKYMFQTD
jgi:hypothetical protein